MTDTYPDVQEWNQALSDHYAGSSWYKASWLFSECYLYRRIKEAFARTEHWRDYDPFFEQKKAVFKSSQKAVVAIAGRLMSPVRSKTTQAVEALSSLDILIGGPESKGTEEAFFELAQVCLWGNATDLSLLDNPDLAKVEELQRRMMMSSNSTPTSHNSSTLSLDEGTNGAQSELAKHADKILQNDLDQLWTKVKSLRNGRVDIILDNAGMSCTFMLYLVLRVGFAHLPQTILV